MYEALERFTSREILQQELVRHRRFPCVLTYLPSGWRHALPCRVRYQPQSSKSGRAAFTSTITGTTDTTKIAEACAKPACVKASLARKAKAIAGDIARSVGKPGKLSRRPRSAVAQSTQAFHLRPFADGPGSVLARRRGLKIGFAAAYLFALEWLRVD